MVARHNRSGFNESGPEIPQGRFFVLLIILVATGGAVGPMNLDELVVDAQKQERRCPLADKEGAVVLVRCLHAERYGH